LRLNLTPLEARISARRAWSGVTVGDSHQDADFAFLGAYQSA
jgi:hypothetical protein